MFTVLPEICCIPGFRQIGLQELICPPTTTIETMGVLMGRCYMGFHATHAGDGLAIGTDHRFTMGLFGTLVKANETIHFLHYRVG